MKFRSIHKKNINKNPPPFCIYRPKSPYHFRLSLCKGDTPATAGYFVRMTNRTKEAICLGPVQVFNSRTTTVLKSDTLVLLKPGKCTRPAAYCNARMCTINNRSNFVYMQATNSS